MIASAERGRRGPQIPTLLIPTESKDPGTRKCKPRLSLGEKETENEKNYHPLHTRVFAYCEAVFRLWTRREVLLLECRSTSHSRCWEKTCGSYSQLQISQLSITGNRVQEIRWFPCSGNPRSEIGHLHVWVSRHDSFEKEKCL